MLVISLILITIAILVLLFTHEFRKSAPSAGYLYLLALVALVCVLIVAHETGLSPAALPGLRGK